MILHMLRQSLLRRKDICSYCALHCRLKVLQLESLSFGHTRSDKVKLLTSREFAGVSQFRNYCSAEKNNPEEIKSISSENDSAKDEVPVKEVDGPDLQLLDNTKELWQQGLFTGEDGEINDDEFDLEDLDSAVNDNTSHESLGDTIPKKRQYKSVKPLAVIDSVLPEHTTSSSDELGTISELVQSKLTLKRNILPEDIPVPPVEVKIPKRKLVLADFDPILKDDKMLQSLDGLGVDFALLQKAKLTEYVLTRNFDEHVKPVLLFLSDSGVPGEMLGPVINRFPYILTEPLHNMKVQLCLYIVLYETSKPVLVGS